MAKPTAPQNPRYKLKISKRARKGRADLPKAKQRAVNQIIQEYLAVNPLDRLPGKTKVLHGRYKGILQYNVDDKYRIHYTVDRQNMIVYIDFIGPHPEW